MVTNNEQDLEREVDAQSITTSTGTNDSSSAPTKAGASEQRAPSSNISIIKRLLRFWQEAMVEWKKITFPDATPPWKMKSGQWGSTNKGELYKLTIGVFVISSVIAVVISLMDVIAGLAYRGLITIFTK